MSLRIGVRVGGRKGKKVAIDKTPLHQSIPHQKYFPSLHPTTKQSIPHLLLYPPLCIRHFFYHRRQKKYNNVIMSFDFDWMMFFWNFLKKKIIKKKNLPKN